MKGAKAIVVASVFLMLMSVISSGATAYVEDTNELEIMEGTERGYETSIHSLNIYVEGREREVQPPVPVETSMWDAISTRNLVTILYIILIALLFFLLKDDIKEYGKGRGKKKIVFDIIGIALITLFVIISMIFLTVRLERQESLLFIHSQYILFLPVIFILYRHISSAFKRYRLNKNGKKTFKKLMSISMVILIVITSSLVTMEYISTPYASKRYVITLERNETGNIELIIPNLQDGDEYLPLGYYKIVEGEGSIQSYMDGEYIIITTDSLLIRIEFFEEDKMFEDYRSDLRFPEEKIRYHERLDYLNISYFSEQNAEAFLTVDWTSSYRGKIRAFSQTAVRGHGWVDNQSENIRIYEWYTMLD